MQAPYININGKLIESQSASVPFDNRAFRYGYGLFETILFRNGEIELKEYHVNRLFTGAGVLALQIPVHMNAQWFEGEIKRTVNKNKLNALARIRLQLYAGSGGMMQAESAIPEYIIECFPLDEPITQLNENGLVLGIAEDLHKSIDTLSNIKSCNALIYVMAAKQAATNKWNDALIYNTSENIIESTIANIFWVKDDIIYTPPLTEGCIAGIMRSKLLRELPNFGYNVTEIPLTYDLLMQADEVFLTNAIRRIKWVSTINNKIYKHQLVRQIAGKLL